MRRIPCAFLQPGMEIATYVRGIEGTVVELSTDQVAIVVKNFSDFPITPKVRILVEPDGTPAEPSREIDLTGQIKIVIKRVLREDEVKTILNSSKVENLKSRVAAEA